MKGVDYMRKRKILITVAVAASITVLTSLTALANNNAQKAKGNKAPVNKVFQLKGSSVFKEILKTKFNVSEDEVNKLFADKKPLKEILKAKNIDFNTFVAAVKEYRINEINKAVEAGKLTREKADKLIEKINKSHNGNITIGKNNKKHKKNKISDIDKTVLKEVFGLTDDEINGFINDKKSVGEVLKLKNIDKTKYAEAKKTERIKQIDKAVADGKITKEKAEKIKEKINNPKPKEPKENKQG